jgi:threonine dehydrogenase-like Zn-dependent dehydrogenase
LKLMKALVYTGPHSLEYREEEEPTPGPDEVLVRVEAVGICGSDMHAYHGHDSRRPAPLVLGHETAGRIVSGPRKGERVTVDPLVTCGTCEYCTGGRSQLCRSRQIISMPPRPGAFAELVRIPERNLVAIPDGFDIGQAALAEPLAVSYHAVHQGARVLARPLSSARCVVLGGGAIGLATALVLAMEGAREIHIGETNPARRRTAAESGDFRVYAPGGADEPGAASIDLVVDAVGAQSTREASSRLVKPGGAIVHVGLLPGQEGYDIRRITLEEILVSGTYCYSHADFCEVVDALVEKRFGSLEWYEERSLENGAGAFRELDEGVLSAAKIVLRL